MLSCLAAPIADLTCCFIYPASQCEVDVKSLVYTGYVQLPNKISEVLAQPIVSKNQVCCWIFRTFVLIFRYKPDNLTYIVSCCFM